MIEPQVGNGTKNGMNRRGPNGHAGQPEISGVPVRPDDIEPTRGLHSVAILFRVLSGLLGLLMVMQVFLGLTSTVAISFGVLFAEAVRLVIFAGLLWACGDLADLYVKSHYDLRATRIIMSRLNYRVTEAIQRMEAAEDSRPPVHGPDDGTAS